MYAFYGLLLLKLSLCICIRLDQLTFSDVQRKEEQNKIATVYLDIRVCTTWSLIFIQYFCITCIFISCWMQNESKVKSKWFFSSSSPSSSFCWIGYSTFPNKNTCIHNIMLVVLSFFHSIICKWCICINCLSVLSRPSFFFFKLLSLSVVPQQGKKVQIQTFSLDLTAGSL